ncbi:helix-turn-helix transcriptional regulator [Alicyclobacillus fructus]
MRRRREELGLTQAEAAARAGMKRQNWAHIERGRHEPNLSQMKAIAIALETEPTLELFENSESEDTKGGQPIAKTTSRRGCSRHSSRRTG